MGLDVARALAIVGMLAVHVGPTDVGDVAGRVYALPHGRASVLFVLLAGIGVALLAGSPRTSSATTRSKLAWRAAVLLPLGMLLQELDHGAFVILQEYALLFALALVAVQLGDRWLLGAAALVASVGPVVHLVGQMRAPEVFERDGVAVGDSLVGILHGLVLSGPFPLITWAAPFLLGMWLGRRDLRSPRVRVGLVAGGGLAAGGAYLASSALVALVGNPTGPVGWDLLIARSAHSQMPLWLLGATGAAAATVGLCLMAADRAGRLLWPLAATGQLALTIYVGHLMALHAAPDALTSEAVGPAVGLVAAVTLVAVALATGWRALLPRGPLEVLLHLPWLGGRDPGRPAA